MPVTPVQTPERWRPAKGAPLYPRFHRVPEEFRDHKLLVKETFYTLPQKLLMLLIEKCGRDALDPDTLALDECLSEILSKDPSIVGYRDRNVIWYSRLSLDEPRFPVPDAQTLAALKWRVNPLQLAHKLEVLQPRLQRGISALRGYVGWLMTNPQFLSERDALLRDWSDVISDRGLLLSGPTVRQKPQNSPQIEIVYDKRSKEYVDALDKFFKRWRLLHLVTPELPEPLSPQIGDVDVASLLTNRAGCGVVSFQPDTMPIPPRDDLRDSIEDARAGPDQVHLGEWLAMVHKSKESRNAIRGFEIKFVLNHYWNVIRSRYATLFDGNIGNVEKSLAEFLKLKISAVRNHRRVIARRLAAARPGQG